jgi:hypothetical protein
MFQIKMPQISPETKRKVASVTGFVAVSYVLYYGYKVISNKLKLLSMSSSNKSKETSDDKTTEVASTNDISSPTADDVSSDAGASVETDSSQTTTDSSE